MRYIIILPDKIEVSQYQNPQYDTVITECFKVVGFDVAHQELDGQYGYYECYQHAGCQNDDFTKGKCQTKLQELQ